MKVDLTRVRKIAFNATSNAATAADRSIPSPEQLAPAFAFAWWFGFDRGVAVGAGIVRRVDEGDHRRRCGLACKLCISLGFSLGISLGLAAVASPEFGGELGGGRRGIRPEG